MNRPIDLLKTLMGPDPFAHLAEDAVWRLPRGLWEGLAGEHRGLEAIQTFFAQHVATFYDLSTMQRDVLYVFGDDTRAAVRFNFTCKTTWGEDYENESLLTIECRDGKIVQVEEMFDTKHLHDIVDTSKVNRARV